MIRQAVLLCCAFALLSQQAAGVAIRYEETPEEKFRPVMVPVSSTVIPLDDLPSFRVGFGFGFDPEQFDKSQALKGKDKKKFDLITAQNKKKQSAEVTSTTFNGAKIQPISEEDFRRFT